MHEEHIDADIMRSFIEVPEELSNENELLAKFKRFGYQQDCNCTESAQSTTNGKPKLSDLRHSEFTLGVISYGITPFVVNSGDAPE